MLGGFVIRGSSIQNLPLRTWIQKLWFGFHTVRCRPEAHIKERIFFFFHLLHEYSLQCFKILNNKPIPLSRGVLKVPPYDVLVASRCTPGHRLMSSAGYVLLVHYVTWLLSFLPGVGQLCRLSTLKQICFPSIYVCT